MNNLLNNAGKAMTVLLLVSQVLCRLARVQTAMQPVTRKLDFLTRLGLFSGSKQHLMSFVKQTAHSFSVLAWKVPETGIRLTEWWPAPNPLLGRKMFVMTSESVHDHVVTTQQQQISSKLWRYIVGPFLFCNT